MATSLTNPGSVTYDPVTEGRLDEWVTAKRAKDWGTADAIRSELLAQGVDCDKARPPISGPRAAGGSRGGGGGQWAAPVAMPAPAPAPYVPPLPAPQAGGGSGLRNHGSEMHDAHTEQLLDQWVQAKRSKDYQTADALRAELSQAGVDAESARPAIGGRPANAPKPALLTAPVPTVFPAVQVRPVTAPASRPGPVVQMISRPAPVPVVYPAAASQHAAAGAAPGLLNLQQGGLRNPGSETYDADTEAQLDQWVLAKRAKDWGTADGIRNDLLARGIDAEAARPGPGQRGNVPQPVLQVAMQPVYVAPPAPAPVHMGDGGLRNPGSYMYDAETEARLDEWVHAKRAKDYATADRLRSELEAAGVEPEKARPKISGAGPAGGGASWQPVALIPTPQPRLAPPPRLPPLRAPPPHPSGAAPDGGGLRNPGSEVHDPHVEALLDSWVNAKRAKDWGTADQLRAELQQHGVNAEQARPAIGGGQLRPGVPQGYRAQYTPPVYQPPAPLAPPARYAPYPPVAPAAGGAGAAQHAGNLRNVGSETYDAATEQRLDEWVVAKRAKDYATADRLRAQLKADGVDPETARPK